MVVGGWCGHSMFNCFLVWFVEEEEESHMLQFSTTEEVSKSLRKSELTRTSTSTCKGLYSRRHSSVSHQSVPVIPQKS